MSAAQTPVIAGIRWILENRTHDVDGTTRSYNATSFARAAGLSRGHVEQLLAGRHKGNLGRETAIKIARAGNVRLAWLLTGDGAREPFDESETAAPAPVRFVESLEQYPSRAQFIALARAEGADEAILEAVRLYRFAQQPAEDVTVDFWREVYKDLARQRKAFRRDLRAINLDDETPSTEN